MKQKSSLKDRLVGSRYFSFGITLSLFVLLYVVGMMNYRGFMKPQVFCNLLIDNAALIIATIGITFVLALSGTINLSFVLSQVMTGGGPNGASSVLLQYMYTQGFVNGNFGYAMAITVFTLAISVALSMLSRKLTDASEGGQ